MKINVVSSQLFKNNKNSQKDCAQFGLGESLRLNKDIKDLNFQRKKYEAQAICCATALIGMTSAIFWFIGRARKG